jgi:hypothetical protein
MICIFVVKVELRKSIGRGEPVGFQAGLGLILGDLKIESILLLCLLRKIPSTLDWGQHMQPA